MKESAGAYHFTPDPELREDLSRRRALRKHTGGFLLAGGILAGHSDGALVDEEKAVLVVALEALFDDPAGELERLDSPERAVAMLEESIAWLRAHAGAKRAALYRHLALLVVADGVVADGEVRFMRNVAALLGLEADEASAVLRAAMNEAGIA